jgi:hypothetical protein
VHFLVAGLSAGTAPLVQNGTSSTATATLTLSSAISGATTVLAQYPGDGTSFAPSSGSVTTKDPTLTPHVTSSKPRTKYGWYRTPVKVTWTCTAGSGTLVGSCPAATTLSASKAKQSVTKTIKKLGRRHGHGEHCVDQHRPG